MNQPYQRQPMDRSAHRGRMVNLMLRGGDITAAGAQQQGAIDANLWTGLTGVAAGTMAGLFSPEAQLKRQEIKDREATLKEREQARSKADNLDGLMQMIGQMPPDDAAEVLDQEGYRDEAAKLRQQTKAKRDMIREEQEAKFTAAQRNLEQAATLMSSVTARSTPEAQASQYAAVLPKVRELLGEDGAAQLGVTEQYDPAVAASAAEWTMTAAQRVNHRRQMWADANTERGTKEQRLQQGAVFLAGLQADVDTQDEWTTNIALAKAMGAPDEAVDMFGPTFTPEAVQKAQKLAPAKKGPAEKQGDFEAYVRTQAQQKGRALTEQELLQARARWEAAGRAPKDAPADRPGKTGLSPESYAVAVRDKANRLAEAEAAFRRNDIDRDELERRKTEALRAFDEQVSGGGPRPRGMADMAGGGQDPTKAQAPRQQQAQVPTAVRNAMVKGPGDYAFKGGSVWRMQRDGQIVRIK